VLAGLGQAVGLVLSKQGMFGDFSPFQANAIRMLAAVIFIWGWTALEGKVVATFAALHDKPRVIGLIALGAVVGPLLGISASLLAVQHAEVGVASTLMAVTPVIRPRQQIQVLKHLVRKILISGRLVFSEISQAQHSCGQASTVVSPVFTNVHWTEN
jgi:hypothetical protein